MAKGGLAHWAVSRIDASGPIQQSADAKGRKRPYFLTPVIPLIQARHIIDVIGSSGARAFGADDFGQPPQQGNSKAQSSSPGRHWPVAGFIRQVKGNARDCWMGMAVPLYRREFQTSLSPIDAEGRAVMLHLRMRPGK